MLFLLRELHANANSEKAKKACRLFLAHSNWRMHWQHWIGVGSLTVYIGEVMCEPPFSLAFVMVKEIITVPAILFWEVCHNNAYPEIVFLLQHEKTSILSCRTNGQIVFYTTSPMTFVFINVKLVVLCFIIRHELIFVFYFNSWLRFSFRF